MSLDGMGQATTLMPRTPRIARPVGATTMRQHRSVQKPFFLFPTQEWALDCNNNAFACVVICDEGINGTGAENSQHDGDQSKGTTRQFKFQSLHQSTSTLQRISSLASWLCLLDCTILPAVTLLVPMLGLANQGSDRLEFLHHAGHFATIYFLLPMGCLSTITNYLVHRQRWIAGLGGLGLLLVVMANSYALPFHMREGGHLDVFHTFHHGLCHRMVNLSGCACLLKSNHWSHQVARRTNWQDADAACCILHQNQQPKRRRLRTQTPKRFPQCLPGGRSLAGRRNDLHQTNELEV
jgi:hypothetical protein